jgi:phosphatidylinositol glycan class O
MEKGEIFTPASEITGARRKVATQAPATKAQIQVPKRNGPPVDEDKAKRAAQVHFKASHGLTVAFFTIILYVCKPLSFQLLREVNRG